VLDYAIKFGELGQIQIDNMNQQMRALRDRRNSSRIASVDILTEPANVGEIAVVAFADGPGLAAAYRSMGATSVFQTVSGSTPGVEELLSAVDATASNQVILLPNNPTTLLAAGCLPELTNHRVVVVPSRSAPQGMAALEAFTDDATLEANVAAMTSAANVVRTIEVSRVDSDAQVNGTSVSQGGFVGLLNGVVVASGYDADEVALEAICLGCGEEAELITVFVGECGSPAESAALREIIESKCKGAEIQIYDGGQAHCRYIVAVE
jgi:dihydroxyacetone kinase-like predicted kinase